MENIAVFHLLTISTSANSMVGTAIAICTCTLMCKNCTSIHEDKKHTSQTTQIRYIKNGIVIDLFTPSRDKSTRLQIAVSISSTTR
jgi:hypothetical protein